MRPVFLLVAIAAAACSAREGAAPLAPLEACRATAAINCTRAYECLDAPERELLGFPARPEDCLAELERACGEEPEEEFCADGETYSPESAGACMAEMRAASCERIAEESAETWAPSCAEMCRPAG